MSEAPPAAAQTRLQTTPLYRLATVESVTRAEAAPADGDAPDGAVRDGDATVTLAFSSETPVPRWDWMGEQWLEVLDHDTGSVRMDWLGGGRAPFLADHENSVASRVGVIERAWIGNDRVGRAQVRLAGRSGLAAQLRDEIDAGMLPNVSVGYRVHALRLDEEREDGPDTYRATDWEPVEISAVSIPADSTVGLGRAAGADGAGTIETVVYGRPAADDSARSDVMSEGQTPESAAPAAPPEARAVVAAVPAAPAGPDPAEVAAGERDRISQILALGRAHNMTELAEEHAFKSTSVDAFRALVLERMGSAPALPARGGDLDMEPRQVREYSLVRAIRAAYNNDWRGAEFEAECSRTIAENLNRDNRSHGFFVPWEVHGTMVRNAVFRDQLRAQHGRARGDAIFAREMSTGGTATGAELVGTEHRGDLFIEYLRERSAVIGFGARVLTGLQQDISIPRQDGTTTWAWLAEGADSTAADIATGALPLAPKTIAGSVGMTRKLLIQSDPSVDAMVRADMMVGLPIAVDLAAINGSGTGAEPRGVRNTTGVGTVTIAASAGTGIPTWAEWVAFESAVHAGNALDGELGFITTAALVGGAKTTSTDAGSGRFCMEMGQINGYPVRKRDAVGAKSITFGDWSQVIVAFWGVMEIQADTATKAASGGLVLRAFHEADVGVRHPVAFAKEA